MNTGFNFAYKAKRVRCISSWHVHNNEVSMVSRVSKLLEEK